jgi:hypothetical protein
MVTVSRDELHRVVEQLSDDRLTAAAELLESLALHDQRVSVWLQNLSPAEESEIADSLRREYAADEWVTDQTVATWIDSLGDGCDPEPQPPAPPRNHA